MKFNLAMIAAVIALTTSVTALPTDMHALEERNKDTKATKPAGHDKPVAKVKAKAPNTGNKAPTAATKTSKAASSGKKLPQNFCRSQASGKFNTKWAILSVGSDTMGTKKNGFGGEFLKKVRKQYHVGQIAKPCAPMDWQAVPDDQNHPTMMALTFYTSNECGGAQIAKAIREARQDHLIMYCSDNLGAAITSDVSIGGNVAATIASSIPQIVQAASGSGGSAAALPVDMF